MKPETRSVISQTLPLISNNMDAKNRFFEILNDFSPGSVSLLVTDHQATRSCFYSFLLVHVAVADQKEYLREVVRTQKITDRINPSHLGYIKKAMIRMVQEVLGKNYTAHTLDAWDTALNEMTVTILNTSEN